MTVYRHFSGRVVCLDTETVTLPNGSTLEMEIVRHPGGAAVVALDSEDRICLLRQYRYVVGDWLWELPAGKIDHEEPPLQTAQRELAEEAGVAAARWDDLGYTFSSPGVFDERVYLYLARDLTTVPAAQEPHEVFEVHWIPFDDAMEWAQSGEIVDAKTLIALYRCAQGFWSE